MSNGKTASQIRQGVGFQILLILYFAGLVFGALQFPAQARLFPIVLGILGLLISLALLYKDIRAYRNLPAGDVGGVGKNKLTVISAVAFGLAVTYLVAVYLVGFMLATFAMTLVVPYLLGQKQVGKLVMVAVILLGTIWLVFHVLLMVNFPQGLLGII